MPTVLLTLTLLSFSLCGIAQTKTLTGSWMNYLHLQHKDTIEFVPASLQDSLYKMHSDDFHYAWDFSRDSVIHITKEHLSQRSPSTTSTPTKHNFFIPPDKQMKVDYKDFDPMKGTIALHTWDNIWVPFQQKDDLLNITIDGETMTYRIVDLQKNLLRVAILDQ